MTAPHSGNPTPWIRSENQGMGEPFHQTSKSAARAQYLALFLGMPDRIACDEEGCVVETGAVISREFAMVDPAKAEVLNTAPDSAVSWGSVNRQERESRAAAVIHSETTYREHTAEFRNRRSL